jgi:hypothetical protein
MLHSTTVTTFDATRTPQRRGFCRKGEPDSLVPTIAGLFAEPCCTMIGYEAAQGYLTAECAKAAREALGT